MGAGEGGACQDGYNRQCLKEKNSSLTRYHYLRYWISHEFVPYGIWYKGYVGLFQERYNRMHAAIDANFYYTPDYPFREHSAIHPVFKKSLWVPGALESIIRWKNR